jgi:uncharacterized protein Yka (UPF0111/DUF47 family)
MILISLILDIICTIFKREANHMISIFNVFGPSPIRPLEQHMRKTYLCAKQLYPLFEAALELNWKLVKNRRSRTRS